MASRVARTPARAGPADMRSDAATMTNLRDPSSKDSDNIREAEEKCASRASETAADIASDEPEGATATGGDESKDATSSAAVPVPQKRPPTRFFPTLDDAVRHVETVAMYDGGHRNDHGEVVVRDGDSSVDSGDFTDGFETEDIQRELENQAFLQEFLHATGRAQTK